MNSFELWATLKADMESSVPGQVKKQTNPPLDPELLDFRDFQCWALIIWKNCNV